MLKYTIAKDSAKTYLKEVRYIPTYVAKYRVDSKYEFKILPITRAIRLYADGQLKFIGERNYNRMVSALKETTDHIDNPNINFTSDE
uniref:Uncharacterized protein n=1 Tax=candidate division WOR-3 bacterium TaxID=2052148 RepID=A0A7V0Z424_UNCW3